MTASIAFLGLGIMGSAMARRLIEAGFTVSVFNRNPERSAPFAGAARIAASPRDAAEGADLIMAMVTDDAASRHLWLGDEGALAGIRAGAVCLEASTLTPDWIAAWAGHVTASGGKPLDAPVTGTKPHAETGQLVFIAGGESETLDSVRPALEVLGRKVVHMGPSGSGAMFKLINNFMGGVQVAALAEAFAMIDRSGLNLEQAVETLLDGSPGSPMVKMIAGRVMADDYRPNFQVALQAKDMVYAIAAAGSLGVDLVTVRAALTSFEAAMAEGRGADDIAAVVASVRHRP
ncbi:NAD(P)-dependent oxidoreductase [Asticcacaulis sp. BYS171W]|uniref:NAD(P)-dependent oxidoreductase n=1 Tax=Asticcacaulis aquaticus TaxID=2984212 RepID=A0ABT5HYH5_9CAUL|nr:NAD(P)-dependent oxidoreductase [Asticcacaulis aquaticus]MDC7685044.1 NAD(P)-dependent oxidoreductase [Asticcacaulis aquaticus]